MLKYFYLIKLLLIAVLCVIITSNSFACTRLLSSDNGQAIIVGRTMDFHESMPVKLIIHPRNIDRNGMATNPLQWTSKYASITTTVFDHMALDGMNEQGLGAHLLWFDSSNYGKRNERLPGLSLLLWAQYYLDNFAKVNEAIEFTKANHFQIETFYYPNTDHTRENELNLHLVLEDATGDSAIIEYISGKLHVYHDPSYKVVTNEPKFDKQLEDIAKYEGFSGMKPLPGNTSSMDRFARASYHVKHLPSEVEDSREALTHLMSALQAVSTPYTTQLDTESPTPTIWRIAADLTNKIYYFNLSNSLHFIWVDFSKLDLSSKAPTRELDVNNIDELFGEVSQAFKTRIQ